MNRQRAPERNLPSVSLAIGALLFSMGSQTAAEEPLVTDRPDFTESSSSLGKGYLQLESGFTFVEFEAGTDVSTVPEILARRLSDSALITVVKPQIPALTLT